MKKKYIIKKDKRIEEILKEKNQIQSKYYYLYKSINKNTFRFAICVSKKTGIAVVRNKIKRQIKNIIRTSNLKLYNNDYVIIVKQKIKYASYNEMKEDLLFVFKNYEEGNNNEK